jgi:excisionase family DNA binding protein
MMNNNPEPISLETLLTISQAARLLQVGRSKMYALFQEGLPTIRIGHSVRISPTTLQEWIAQHEQRTCEPVAEP